MDQMAPALVSFMLSKWLIKINSPDGKDQKSELMVLFWLQLAQGVFAYLIFFVRFIYSDEVLEKIAIQPDSLFEKWTKYGKYVLFTLVSFSLVLIPIAAIIYLSVLWEKFSESPVQPQFALYMAMTLVNTAQLILIFV
jgi:hypothetical protein